MKEKLQNFWYYNKVYVLIAAAILAVIGWRIFLKARTPEPDYHIALVCAEGMNDTDRAKIENAIAENGTDRNEDGVIRVQLHLYQTDVGSDIPNAEAVGGLDADLFGKLSGLFLIGKIDEFRQQTDALAEPVVPLSEIPALAGVGYTELYFGVRAEHPEREAYQAVFDSLRK